MATFVHWLRKGLLPSANHKPISEQEIELGLDDRCARCTDSSGQRVETPQSAFNDVRRFLEYSPDAVVAKEWSKRPRIYTILRRINCLDVMPDFIRGNLRDIMLPLHERDLPSALREGRHEFVQEQIYCLTEARKLELGENGQHVQFAEDGDKYFEPISILGSGGHGHVDVVRSRWTTNVYARKRMMRDVTPEATRQRFEWYETEIKALKKLSHQHLVRIMGTYTDRRCFAFLMVPVADGNLKDYLDRMTIPKLGFLRNFFGCLINAVAYLHSSKVWHLDLKLENVLVQSDKVYLTDFGTAHDFSHKDRSTTWSKTPGTHRYMPPERISNPHAGKNSGTDIWSLGVIFLEMTTVLRGATLKSMRDHFASCGTKEMYVNNNSVATNKWLEYLVDQAGPEYDNLPLTWIKDMLTVVPARRPRAAYIKDEITGAQGFCGFCCAAVEQVWARTPGAFDELESDHQSLFDVHELARVDIPNLPAPPSMESKKIKAIQTWISENQGSIGDGSDNEPRVEINDLPYDIEDDDSASEKDEGRAASVHDEKDEHKHNQGIMAAVSHNLQEVNLFPTSDNREHSSQHETEHGTAHLVFDIVSDCSTSAASADPIVCEDDKEGNTSPRYQLTVIDEDEGARLEPSIIVQKIARDEDGEESTKTIADVDDDADTQLAIIDKPSRLTTKNLQQLDTAGAVTEHQRSTTKYSGRYKSRVVARDYMQQICGEEHEVATTIMTERTRQKLKGLSLSVWADRSSSILESYVKSGKTAAVRQLLKAGANPGTKSRPNKKLLLRAVNGASQRHNKCAEALLAAGADVDIKVGQTRRSILSLAIEHDNFPGYLQLIYLLLRYGANPNTTDRNGDCPLLQILYGQFNTLEEHRRGALALLLQHSKVPVDLNVKPSGTRNEPLHLAVRLQDPWAVGMLLDKGAAYDAKNGAGQTPFALAVSTWLPGRRMKQDHKEVARLLLARGTDSNMRLGAEGSVLALHSAIRNGHKDLVAVLMHYNADPFLRDLKKQTAFDVCEELKQRTDFPRELIDEIADIMRHEVKVDWRSEASSSLPGTSLPV